MISATTVGVEASERMRITLHFSRIPWRENSPDWGILS